MDSVLYRTVRTYSRQSRTSKLYRSTVFNDENDLFDKLLSNNIMVHKNSKTAGNIPPNNSNANIVSGKLGKCKRKKKQDSVLFKSLLGNSLEENVPLKSTSRIRKGNCLKKKKNNFLKPVKKCRNKKDTKAVIGPELLSPRLRKFVNYENDDENVGEELTDLVTRFEEKYLVNLLEPNSNKMTNMERNVLYKMNRTNELENSSVTFPDISPIKGMESLSGFGEVSVFKPGIISTPKKVRSVSNKFYSGCESMINTVIDKRLPSFTTSTNTTIVYNNSSKRTSNQNSLSGVENFDLLSEFAGICINSTDVLITEKTNNANFIEDTMNHTVKNNDRELKNTLNSAGSVIYQTDDVSKNNLEMSTTCEILSVNSNDSTEFKGFQANLNSDPELPFYNELTSRIQYSENGTTVNGVGINKFNSYCMGGDTGQFDKAIHQILNDRCSLFHTLEKDINSRKKSTTLSKPDNVSESSLNSRESKNFVARNFSSTQSQYTVVPSLDTSQMFNEDNTVQSDDVNSEALRTWKVESQTQSSGTYKCSELCNSSIILKNPAAFDSMGHFASIENTNCNDTVIANEKIKLICSPLSFVEDEQSCKENSDEADNMKICLNDNRSCEENGISLLVSYSSSGYVSNCNEENKTIISSSHFVGNDLRLKRPASPVLLLSPVNDCSSLPVSKICTAAITNVSDNSDYDLQRITVRRPCRQQYHSSIDENCSKLFSNEADTVSSSGTSESLINSYLYLPGGKNWRRSMIVLKNYRDHSVNLLADEVKNKGRNWAKNIEKLINLQNNMSMYTFNNGNNSTARLFSCSSSILPPNYGLRNTSFGSSTFIGRTVLNIKEKTAEEVILDKCNQNDPLPFESCITENMLKTGRKIGEGVYGEVYYYKKSRSQSAILKIIPIEGTQLVNGSVQKKFAEIVTEIVVSSELSNLRDGISNFTDCFCQLNRCLYVRGKYPEFLVNLWNDYDEIKGSENDCPTMFKDNQLYIILELCDGGSDLESFEFASAQQALSVIKQTIFALAVAEEALQFEHRDLHWGNILISRTYKSENVYCINNEKYKVKLYGVKVTIIDFTLSRITCDGDQVLYSDLGADPDLFTAEGDFQFEVYRLMKDVVQNEWNKFRPRTNVLWVQYLLDKLINAAKYKRTDTRVHKTSMQTLNSLLDLVPSMQSCYQMMDCNELFL